MTLKINSIIFFAKEVVWQHTAFFVKKSYAEYIILCIMTKITFSAWNHNLQI